MFSQLRTTACLALIGIALVGCGAVTSPTPTTRPTAGPAANPSKVPATASPSPTSRPSARGVDWELRDVWFENPTGRAPSIVGVTRTGTGFVVWGPNQIGGSAILVSSADLSGWTDGGQPGQFDHVRISAMAQATVGIVALGSYSSSSTAASSTQAWRSTDGVSWTAGPKKSGIEGDVRALITSADGTLVAAGSTDGGCDVAIWISADGFAWQASAPLTGARGTCTTGDTFVGPTIELLGESARGMVAYGLIPGIGHATWTSADRVHWTFHPQPSAGGNVVALAGTDRGFIAVGDSGTGSAAAWVSTDGVAWTPAPDQAAFAAAGMSDVAQQDDGSFVAVGSDAANNLVAWTSPDGLSWLRGPSALYPSGSAVPSGSDWTLARDAGTVGPSGRLMAVGGGSRVVVSPPVTPGLRSATITVALSGRMAMPSKTVSGTCSDADDGSGGTVIQADFGTGDPAFPVLAQVTPAGQITDFRINTDGLSIGLGQGLPIDPSTLTIAPGATPTHGSATFRNLVDAASGPGATLLAGSIEWTCAP